VCEPRLFDTIPMRYVCRALRWSRYRARVASIPRYTESLVLEPLEAAHRRALEEFSSATRSLQLLDPPDDPSQVPDDEDPCWLVVHSVPREEVDALVSYAEGARAIERDGASILVVSPGDAGVASSHRSLDVYPASSLFPRASRVFTACGFNVMRQMQPWRDKHVFIPFERPLDDQFARAARARRERPIATSYPGVR
jgi:hypothetical protein